MKLAARELIVDSAVRKFAEFGIERVSLDEIAQAARMHRSTLHRHFPEGREAVIIAAMDREAESAAAQLTAAAAAAPNAAAAFSAELTELVVLSRANQTVRLLLAQDTAKQAVLTSATTRFRTLAGQHWKQLAERARKEGLHITPASAEAVLSHILRVGLSLVTEPGDLHTAADVHNYIEAFITPSLISPTPLASPKPRRPQGRKVPAAKTPQSTTTHT